MNFTKKLFLLMAMFGGCMLQSWSQYNTRNDWYVGLNAGKVASNIVMVPKMVDKFYAIGNTAGLTLRYVSEQNFGLQLECNYAESGWKEDYYQTKDWSQYSYSRILQAVDVPILSHLYVQSKAAHFFINAGANFQYLFDEREQFRSGMPLIQHGKKYENSFQYGILGGGGLEFEAGNVTLGMEARYAYHLSNIFHDEVGNDFVNSSLNNVTVKFYLLFNVSGKK